MLDTLRLDVFFHIVFQGGKTQNYAAAPPLGLVDPVTETKYLFEATPNLPEQLYKLETIASDTNYSLEGVFLTHAHMGHYTGLCTSASNHECK